MSEQPNDEQEDLMKCNCCGGLGLAAVCPGCNGAGKICNFETLREAELANRPMLENCDVCRGAGQLRITRELLERLGLKIPN